MSGFFSLGGKDQHQHQDQHHQHHQHQQQQNHHTTDSNNNNNNSSLFLFKNEEIYNKGFELWQQYYQLHQQRLQTHHHHHHQHGTAAAIQDVDFSVGPSRRTTANNNNNHSTTSSIFGSDIGDDSSNYSYRSAAGFRMIRGGGGGRGGSSGGGEGINCQDCGNQAKKDCVHLRCRTCCKSRGFHCQTHVKSTWVPAAKRRERQQQLAALQQDEQQLRENPKRLRENPHGGDGGPSGGVICTTNSSRLVAATTTGFDPASFPSEVNSSAVFRCVKVSAVDDAEEHLAYQTAVHIGGHVFRGILYDQGPEGRYSGGEGSNAGGVSHQPLDLIAAAAASTAAASNTNLSMIDPSINYPTPLSAFMTGTQFFPPPRP